MSVLRERPPSLSKRVSLLLLRTIAWPLLYLLDGYKQGAQDAPEQGAPDNERDGEREEDMLLYKTTILAAAIAAALIMALVLLPVGADYDTYRLTYYDSSYQGHPMFCTGEAFDSGDTTIAATNGVVFDCGDVLQLCGLNGCLTLTVQDRCGGCDDNQLDVSRSAYDALGSDYAVVHELSPFPYQGAEFGSQPFREPNGLDNVELPSTGTGDAAAE